MAFALIGLGRMLLETGRCPEAEPLLREAVAIRVDALEQDAVELAATRLYLGECLVALGAFAEAEPLLLGSHEVLEESRGEDHELTLRARRTLDNLYRATGRPPVAFRRSGPNGAGTTTP